MPDFCKCGADTIVCQAGAHIFCSNPQCPNGFGRKSQWLEAFTRWDGSPGKGNVCTNCRPEVTVPSGVTG